MDDASPAAATSPKLALRLYSNSGLNCLLVPGAHHVGPVSPPDDRRPGGLRCGRTGVSDRPSGSGDFEPDTEADRTPALRVNDPAKAHLAFRRWRAPSRPRHGRGERLHEFRGLLRLTARRRCRPANRAPPGRLHLRSVHPSKRPFELTRWGPRGHARRRACCCRRGPARSAARSWVLLDQNRDHLEMRELLGADILQHVADAGVLGMKRLRPIRLAAVSSPVAPPNCSSSFSANNEFGIPYIDLGLQDGSAKEHGRTPF